MSYTNAQIQENSGSGLPVPIWEVYPFQSRVMADSSTVQCQIPRARVPFIDPALVAEGNLYVEYGRMRGRRYRNRPAPKTYGKGRIYAWSNYSVGNVTTGTGYGGGIHSNVSVARPNRFLITNIGFLAPECPYWAFYTFKSFQAFGGVPSQNIISITAPGMTGESRSNIFDPARSLPPSLGGDYFSPYTNKFHNIRHASSKWYARIIKVVDGRVEAVGDWSEELIVSQFPYPTGYNKVTGIQTVTPVPQFKCTTSNHRQPI